jgi:monoamine oxidase
VSISPLSTYDVIVAGAGMAGLSAARILAERGLRVLILEAQDRVGGRLLTLHPQGAQAPVELGAEFVHGRPPELLALIEEAGLALYQTGGTNYASEGGRLTPNPSRGAAWELLDQLPSPDQPGSLDQPFDQWLAPQQAPEDQRRFARLYVEGFNAADAAVIGVHGLAVQQAAEDAIEGDQSFRLCEGYGALAAYQLRRLQAAGAQVQLATPVTAVHWQPGSVTVHTAGGEHQARALLLAVPIGVLASGTLPIAPLPPPVDAAIQAISPGLVHRSVLQFRTAWWTRRAPGLHFLFTEDALPATWWTTSPHPSHLLVAWAGGPRVQRLEAEAPDPLRTLEQLFSLKPGALDKELVGRYHHDWTADPWTRGAYSSLPAGALEAPHTLAQPVEHTLFFAGEHTDTTGHPGTVHGALRSAQRAAGQILAALGQA